MEALLDGENENKKGRNILNLNVSIYLTKKWKKERKKERRAFENTWK